MTSPLETKARALHAERCREGTCRSGWVDPGCYNDVKRLLAFASEVERETLARCERIAVAHANRWLNEPLRSDARADACMGVAAAIRSLSEPPAETPEPPKKS